MPRSHSAQQSQMSQARTAPAAPCHLAPVFAASSWCRPVLAPTPSPCAGGTGVAGMWEVMQEVGVGAVHGLTDYFSVL